MAVAKKKASTKRRVVSKKVTKKKVASKKASKPKVPKKSLRKRKPASKPRKAAKKRPTKKKVTTKAKKISKKRSVRKKVSAKKLTVKDVDKRKAYSVKIVDKSNIPEKGEVKKVLNHSELKFKHTSRLSFSLPGDYKLSQVARYSGVAAVIIGGLFSMMNLQAIVFLDSNFDALQTANVVDGQNQTPPDPTPEPRIVVEHDGVISETVNISITVPYAENIEVLAKSVSASHIFPLGNADRIDDSNWHFVWETFQFEDREYKLGLRVENIYGQYDFIDSEKYIIDNEPEIPPEDPTDEPLPDDEPQQTPNDDPDAGAEPPAPANTTEDESPVVGDEEPANEDELPPEVIVELSNEEYFTDEARIKIFVPYATKVKLYVKNLDTLGQQFIGYAHEKSETEWEFIWNTNSVVNGEYKLHAVAMIDDEPYKSEYHVLIVENEILASDTTDEEPDETILDDEGETILEDPEVEPDPDVLVPEIDVDIEQDNPVSGFVAVKTETSPVKWVEYYAISENSLILKFLGLAKRESPGKWTYLWDTKQVPNGEYAVYARVKTDYGFTEGDRHKVVVKNEIAPIYTEKQEEHINDLILVEEELIKTTDEPWEIEDELILTESPQPKYVDSTETFVETIELSEPEQEDIKDILDSYRYKLNDLLNTLARATRLNDSVLLQRTREDMALLKKELLQELSTDGETREIINQIDSYISKITFELEETTIQNEKILKDRIGENLFADADNDSISDYDEIHLYKTNPYVADSDGDGFVDGAEIESGYNPNDSSSEALIAYESPKETGIVQEELFVVETITTLTHDTESGDDVPQKALITGRGLPNSFVTIYIFSNPIVVTVRTDDDGSWRYVFDKELDDGEHEVYVGITDNAGKIVGKSEPVAFVKTAEAFTVSASAETLVTPVDDRTSLIGSRTLLLIGSLAVVSLGLVLILLGLHVGDRRKEELVTKTP